MEKAIKDALGTSRLQRMGKGGGGCINEGEGYFSDRGQIFIKKNGKKEARRMFDGELEGLKAMAATQTVRVPKPYAVVDNQSGGAVLIMEYLDMKPLNRHSTKLGELLARMHEYNKELGNKESSAASFVHGTNTDSEETLVKYTGQFGFYATTCCGYIPQDNTWNDDWVAFYTQQRLEHQLRLVEESYGDREARELWSTLQLRIPQFFKDVEIVPALLHGDLWGGNVAELENEPVIFDPATFYGHSEFELAIAGMFGGFSKAFYGAYHSVIPKAPGFETRLQLYQLFHYLNHWNHFGTGYRGSSLSIMRRLTRS